MQRYFIIRFKTIRNEKLRVYNFYIYSSVLRFSIEHLSST